MWKTFEIIVLLVLIAITAVAYVKARKESYEAAKAMDEKLKKEREETKIILIATIDGMMCEKCAGRVTDALSKYGEVKINLEEKTATITASELPDMEEVKDTITELGYTVINIE